MERVMGIEPTQPAWKAGILPLNYTRNFRTLYILTYGILYVNSKKLKYGMYFLLFKTDVVDKVRHI